jgi:hypothetical protein
MSATRILVHGVVRGADAARLGVETVPFAGLAALVSCAPEGGGDDAQRALALARRHHEILCAVAERRDVLPVRLGAVFADADALARGLAGKADLFEARLAHCAGAVEFSLVAEELGAPLVACDAAGRRDYLKARAAARARPARVGAALDALEAEVVAVALAMVASAQGRVGLGLMNARAAVVDVAAKFGLAEDEINFDLGPLGRLL